MFRRLSLVPALAALILSAAAPAHGQTVPTIESVVGHASGAEITRSADVRRYFDALAAADPARVRLGEYGRTWEGRPLFWAAVGSPANIARLDAIKAASRALADPRATSAAQARALIADTPVIVWMAYSVHGDEISPADAAMAAARHLLTTPEGQGWLQNVVVVFVPTQNPDGRERFLAGYEQARGLAPDPDPLSVERDQPWPGGRFNHALFDLNRDWFIQSQPETQGHAHAIQDWRPQVVVDSHEMGSDETFFFPPEAQPLNPWIHPRTLENRALFGRATAARFDQAGLGYFTGKVFDAFYPGYGDGWPGYLGAVSMTYEQGSSRGLAARRASGEVFTYADTVRGHLTASLATIETASRNRERLLNDFYAYHVDGLTGRGAYLISRGGDASAADRLAGLLVRQGVEVGQARAAFSACGRAYQAGDYVVNLAQPQRRMAEVLMNPDVPLDPAFLAEQERRRARGLGDEIYDVTAWSLPLMAGVEAPRCAAAPAVAVEPRGRETYTAVTVTAPDAAWGYLVAPGDASLHFLTAALHAGLDVRSNDKPFVQNGRTWPAGTLILPRAGAPADLTATVGRLAALTGAVVTGVDSSWVEAGASFGGGDVVRLRAPRIAVAWDTPASPTAAGAVRWMLEREYGYPVTIIRTETLAQADLSRFQVVILPSGGGYKGVLGDGGVTNLRDWVSRGGVLISLGSATRLLADPGAEMLAARRERAVAEGEGGDDPSDKAVIDGGLIETEPAYLEQIHSDRRNPDSVAGVLAYASVDPDHWLGAGLPPRLTVLAGGSDIYTPLRRDQGVNAVRFVAADALLASGQLWAENRRQLAFKPVAMVSENGRGHYVAFTQDITTRGYLQGLKGLFLNAVFRGPAHSTPNW
ncbi:MAG: zinc carboxypeptidase [Caulobacterales bacterium]|nr:zinc carboxypeptidase [Caulobacterales bacterium]